VLTGSATSDRADVAPAAVTAAGGRIIRFGMPVDPGNLGFLAELGTRRVIGLPGSARSLKPSGGDWVLERVACGLDPGPDAIAAMGVGGLLKEIPSRPAPRAGGAEATLRPVVSAVVLAAGASRRMGGRDKLLEPVGGARGHQVVLVAPQRVRVLRLATVVVSLCARLGGTASADCPAVGCRLRVRRRLRHCVALEGVLGGFAPVGGVTPTAK
jgi:hypothetical protein